MRQLANDLMISLRGITIYKGGENLNTCLTLYGNGGCNTTSSVSKIITVGYKDLKLFKLIQLWTPKYLELVDL